MPVESFFKLNGNDGIRRHSLVFQTRNTLELSSTWDSTSVTLFAVQYFYVIQSLNSQYLLYTTELFTTDHCLVLVIKPNSTGKQTSFSVI